MWVDAGMRIHALVFGAWVFRAVVFGVLTWNGLAWLGEGILGDVGVANHQAYENSGGFFFVYSV